MVDERTIALYDEKAADYADLVQSEETDSTLQAFMDLLPAGGDVLDLGCGPAFASVKFREAGFKPDPVDASRGMVDMANARFDIKARVMTFDGLNASAVYDGVWANFSLLHAPRAALPRHLDAIAAALRPKGILHIGMKTGTGEARDRIDRKYTYVTETELEALITDAGFKVIATSTGAEAGFDGTVAPFVVMRARKNG